MKFLKLSSGVYVNLDHIVVYDPGHLKLELSNGTTLDVDFPDVINLATLLSLDQPSDQALVSWKN